MNAQKAEMFIGPTVRNNQGYQKQSTYRDLWEALLQCPMNKQADMIHFVLFQIQMR